MPAFLALPPDLTPTALVYRDDLPEIINDVIEDCLGRWRRGDTNGAIGRAKEAQMLAEAYHHHISISVTSVLLMDLYREQDQLGLLPLGPQLRMKAKDALRLQPGYEHRYHAEAVIDYLWGLLNHTSGTNIGALSDYKRALASFEKAVGHWNSNIIRNPTQAGKYKEQISKCEKAIKWIEALRGSLMDDLTASRDRTEVHIPATNGEAYLFSVELDRDELNRNEVSTELRTQFREQDEALTPQAVVEVKQVGSSWIIVDGDKEYLIRNEDQTLNVYGEAYKLARFILAAYTPPLVAYVRSQEVIINDDKYQLHRPDNGDAFDNNLEIFWNERHFAMHIPEDQWAGQYSAQGDYILAKRERQVTRPGDAGVLWNDSQQKWKYGEFIRDPGTGDIHFSLLLPPTVLGDKPLEENIKDKDIGSVRALLKPV